jgi:hypothetical protein
MINLGKECSGLGKSEGAFSAHSNPQACKFLL